MNYKRPSGSNKYIGKEVKEFSNLFSRITEQKSNEQGITFNQGRFLHFIKVLTLRGPLYQKDLEEQLGIRPSSATEMIKKLEALSLIARRDDERDKRSKLIDLTDKGREVEKAIFARLCQLESEMARGVSTEDLQVFFEVLDRFKMNLYELGKERR